MRTVLWVSILAAQSLGAQVATPDGRILASMPDHGTVDAEPAGLKIERRPPLLYPFYVPAGEQVDGTVAVDIDVNERGEVTDARVLSGPQALRKSALMSVLNWRYKTLNVPTRAVVTLNYRKPDGPVPSNIIPGAAFGRAAPPPGSIHVGADVQAAKLIMKTEPVYPPLARQARIQGVVRFQAIIGKDGSVMSASLIGGHPLMVTAAQDAIKGYRYQPTYLNGQPVEVVTEVEVPFTLN